MTTETPCLSGCSKPSEIDYHAEGYPNGPKPAEPPACKCGATVGHVCHAAECVPVCAYHSPTCPARKAESRGSEPPALTCETCGAVLAEGVLHLHLSAPPQDAEPPACPQGVPHEANPVHGMTPPSRTNGDLRRYNVEPQGSERKGVCRHGGLRRKCETCDYAEQIDELSAQNAALKARVEELEGLIVARDQVRGLREALKLALDHCDCSDYRGMALIPCTEANPCAGCYTMRTGQSALAATEPKG